MRCLVLAAIAAAAAGCGDNLVNLDAPAPDASTRCGIPVGSIDVIPGEYAGATVGAGADIAVAEDACADERSWFGASGEDQVIAVHGLTPETYYAIELDTDEDLAFYATTSCDGDGPAEGACLLFVDHTLAREIAEIAAPPTGELLVVVDSADEPAAPATGAYTLRVRAAECVPAILDCTTPGLDHCLDYQCVECATGLDCAAATPTCDSTGACVVGPALCTGDDAGEPDDGPTAAQAIAVPTAVTPTVVAAAVCSLGDGEADWYTFTLGADRALRFELTWADTAADLDLFVVAADGTAIETADATGAGPIAALDSLIAGTYFVRVERATPAGDAAATPYTLTVSVPECVIDFDCAAPATPRCDVGICVAGDDQCTGDDAAEPDDGPAAARVVAGGVGVPQVLTGKVCDAPAAEADWFRLTPLVGQGMTIELDFAAGIDLDVEAFDAGGALLGRSWWVNPEQVTLTYLPAGAVYVKVTRFSGQLGGDPIARPYTITFTRTVAQLCATRASCAAEYSNQIYRGVCAATGACTFIPDGVRVAGAACDSASDCDSALCSYRPFEADAELSVCTVECVMTVDCDKVGAGLTCTTGFATDVCVPACTTNLDCGANQRGDLLEPGQPWDYFFCTTTTGVCSPT